MTGWRVGYACGPGKIIAAMTKIHQYTIMCVPITSQMAACEGLHSSLQSVENMKREYKRRREFVVGELNRIGLKCHMPQGAFYAFPSVRKTGLNGFDFAQKLLADQKVAVVPGSAFGEEYRDNVRISYAASFDKLKEALCRIDMFVQKFKNNHDTESRNKEKKQGYAVYLAQIEALSKVANLIASGMYLEELLRLSCV